jgi:hypothetical protein
VGLLFTVSVQFHLYIKFSLRKFLPFLFHTTCFGLHGHQLGYTVNEQSQWSESASKLYRPSDRRLSAKLVPSTADTKTYWLTDWLTVSCKVTWLDLTWLDRRCHVVSVTDPCGRNLGRLDWSRYLFLSSSSSIVLTRLSGHRSRPTYLLTYSVALVRKRTITPERPLLVGKVGANFCG